MIRLLINAVKILAVCFAFALTGSAIAEDRVVAMWTCEIAEGKTAADVQEANGRWVRFNNKEVAGGDIRSFVTTAIVGDISGFTYLDSFPSIESWVGMRKAMESDAGRALEAELNEVATCSQNSLHNAVESG